MASSIYDVVRQYLAHEIDLRDLRDWLALYQWDLPADEEDLADEADVALVHLRDGHADEYDVRERLGAWLARSSYAHSVWSTLKMAAPLIGTRPTESLSTSISSSRETKLVCA